MKIRNKQTQCLNCGHLLSDDENYCPECGQQNTAYGESVKQLMLDFFHNHLNFDTRIGHSIKPFLLRPGKLTVEYMAGRRKHYVHPIRFYIWMTLIMITVLEMVLMPKLEKEYLADNLIPENEQSIEDNSRSNKPDGLIHWDIGNDALSDSLIQISPADSARIVDSLITSKTEPFGKALKNPKTKPEDLLKHLGINESNPFLIHLAEQAQRLAQNDMRFFYHKVVGSIPLMMFFMIPFVALVMRVFYLFTKFRLFRHFIFTFHIQSFNYLLLSIFFIGAATGYGIQTGIICGVASVAYSLAALRKVYKQHFLLTVMKMFLIGYFYVIILLIMLTFNLLTSFYFF